MNIPYLKQGLIAALIGALGAAYYYDMLILRMPSSWANRARSVSAPAHKKEMILSLWHSNTWHYETKILIWPESVRERLDLIIHAWVAFGNEEGFLKKKIMIQSIALAPNNQDLYLSFEHYPFDKHMAAFDKYMLIESILKTIRDNEPSLRNAMILVRHQPLNDRHLDFSRPWPVEGFGDH